MANSMKKGIEYTGTVVRTDFPNRGIVFEGDEKVIVKGALEGQKITYAVAKHRSNRCEANLHDVLEKSPLETREPACPHFEYCGGCTYQRLEYEEQLKLKSGQVKRILDHAVEGDYSFLGIEGSPMEWGYRNKMEFSFGDACKGGELTLGLHKKGSFYDVLQITDCKITDNDYNTIIKCIIDLCRKYGLSYMHRLDHKGYLRHLLIRRAATTGEILVNLVTTSQWEGKEGMTYEEAVKDPDFLADDSYIVPEKLEDLTEAEFMRIVKDSLMRLNLNGSIVGILHIVNNDLADAVKAEKCEILRGKGFFFEEILGLIFKISTFSFFQTNSFGAEVLYRTVRDFIGDTKDKVVFDLYSGTGTIAQILAPVAKKVIGVEIVDEAVVAARENTSLNDLENCEFITGDVLKVIDSIEDKPDLIVLDPPREGIHPKALERIIAYGVNRIVYVSCKPTSLAEDLVALQKGGYEVTKVKCVDMFPETVHVETVCLLSKLHEAKHHVSVKLDMDEMDLTSAENFNLPKSEDAKQPQCPQEKEVAITEALSHFGMIETS